MERTEKRMKFKNVVKQEGDDNLSAGPPRDGMEVVSLSNKNYFTPPIMDVWPQILENVKDPKDVFTLINTAPVFQGLLEKRKVTALLSLVLPVLMEKEHLESRDILNCRFVSKIVKAGVDDAFVEQQPDWVPHNSYLLMGYDARNSIRRLLDFPQEFTGNPFILRDAYFTLKNCVGHLQHYVNILRILQRFGHQLNSACLNVELNKSPRTVIHVLKQALSYLPNVLNLQLVFGTYDFDDEDEIKWNTFRTSHRQFPVLESLKELSVNFDYPAYTVLPISSFIRPILLAYRKQITSLRWEGHVFRGTSWKSFRFRQVRELEVFFETKLRAIDSERISETLRNVAKLDCPQLESLTVYQRMGGLAIARDMYEALDMDYFAIFPNLNWIHWGGGDVPSMAFRGCPEHAVPTRRVEL